MTIFHFNRSYLDWRVNPRKRKTICVYHYFFSTFFWTWLSWLLFRLIKFSKCMIWQSFSFFVHFFLFLVLMVCLFRATTHVIDDFPDWSTFPHARIFLKRLTFGPKLFRSFLSKKRIMAQKCFWKMDNFGQHAPRHQSKMILRYHGLGTLFCSLKRFGRFETVASLDAYPITKYQFFFKTHHFLLPDFRRIRDMSF